jgi:hypothetical protein
VKQPVDELTRLRRLLIRSWLAMVLIIVALVFWGSYEVKQFNATINLQSERIFQVVQKPIVVQGQNGKDGAPGLAVFGPQGATGAQGNPGTNGTNGSDGLNVTPQAIAQAVSDYLALNPVSGTQGAKGDAGDILQIQVDPTTCILQSKYQDSDSWTFLAQLPIPCASTNDGS